MKRIDYEKMARVQNTNWWFVSRQLLLCQLVQSITPKKQKTVILEIGCGTGSNLSKLSSFGKAIGLDNSKIALSFCRNQGLDARLGDALDLPFKDNFADIVVYADVLEHIADDKRAVAQAYRVLKPGGYLIATVPAYPWLFSLHDIAVGHKRRHTTKSIAGLLSMFEILRCSHFFSYALFPAVAARLVKKLASVEGSDDFSVPGPVNSLLLSLSAAERKAISMGASIPVGTSIICVARKKP
ncbi:class I SAM-dependent methyltransferase [Candidatus Parvarchaeota archaeon]|nr:class I SAM-dependent methyltransferase [Candidatus Parvarchaeota archaeon]